MPDQSTARPLVSVIMPAYNAGRFISEALESVLSQTVDDLEVIVVDDGSTDDTAQVAAQFAARDARVLLLRTANAGVSAARNTAMAAARGRFFALLDADDGWVPTFLADQMRVFEQHPAAAAVTGNARNRGGGLLDGTPVREWPLDVRELSIRDIVEHEDAVFIMTVMRRAVYESIGGFDPGRRRSEDYHFWLRAAVAGFRFVANPEPLGFYRRHASSASANESAMLNAMISVLRDVEPSIPDPAARDAIARQLDRLRLRDLVCRAKAALKAKDGVEASRQFRALGRLRGQTARHGALALVAGVFPSLLLAAYKARSWSQRHRRAAAALAALCGALAIGAVVTLQPKRSQCTMPSEPFRQLDLANASDREHVAADIHNVVTVARKYADRIARLPLASYSPDAIAGHKVIGPRAYNYCRLVQLDELARIHGLEAGVLRQLADVETGQMQAVK